uniref:Immunoglobulin V-set domain-containing protein n=1 Tax=Sinocyclocheilus rhinocerous TaxID=307959 RepID=A0A673K8J3_9TELE
RGSRLCILGQSVVQTPSDLLKKENEFAEIKCTNNVQNYDVIQLYKQSQSIMDLQFMGYLNIKQEIKETKYNDKIKLDGDGRNNVTLTINTLTLNDSAVYFLTAHLLPLCTWTSGSVIIMHASSLAINKQGNLKGYYIEVSFVINN